MNLYNPAPQKVAVVVSHSNYYHHAQEKVIVATAPVGQGDVGQTFWIALEKIYVWCVTQTKRSIFSENKIYVVHTPHTSYLTR